MSNKDLLSSFHGALYEGDSLTLKEYERLNAAQKRQLGALDDLANTLSGDFNRVRVKLDITDEGMAVIMTDPLVTVRVPFSLEKGKGGKAVLRFGLTPGKNSFSGLSGFSALDEESQADIAQALAQEMQIRGRNTLQSQNARSYLQSRHG
ncbi:MAG TPA: hypothetical protein VL625_11855 [Patescibacteria group bacterium]|nr:hypothetical protein [Patescibacteria group bacterium]